MELFNHSRRVTIADLNSEEVWKHVGGIIFVSLLMIVGLLGNVHVLIIFGRRMKPSNHRTFICFLCVVDLISCCIGMPFVLVDLTHPLMFYMTAACKILRMVNYFIGVSSVFIMLVISVDRYRKVCQPLNWQISDKLAKVTCGLVILVAAGLSWPALILFGHTTVETGYVNITGVRCSTDDHYIHTNYQTFFNIALILIVAVAFVIHIVLYSIICRAIKNHNLNNLKIKQIKSLRRVPTPETVTVFSVTDISAVDASESSPQCNKKCNTRLSHSDGSASSNFSMELSQNIRAENDSQNGGIHVKNQFKKFKETRRMTVIFFAIVAIFFISYIPHLMLKIIVYSREDFLESISRPALVTYNTFIWCFFINNVANPIVYMFLDIKFRAEVITFYRRLFLG